MPTAVTAIFGGDSRPLEAEFARVERLAATAGRNITSRVAEASHASFGGIIRELAVIGREIAMGRGMGRVLGSSTILYQYMRNLAGSAKDSQGPIRMVAQAYEEIALGAAQAAKAAIRTAQASEAAFYADAEESEATLESAIADRTKAAAAEQAAIATRAKATAAAQAAEAEEGEAAATGAATIGTTAFTVALGVAALAAGFIYERMWGVKDLLKSLSVEQPDLKDDYIPVLKRHINDAYNAQKQVTDEVNKTEDAYNSASEAAKRTADATKAHYEHLKKMMDIQKEADLAKAQTPQQKEAVEAQYAARALKLQQDQQHEELANKYLERTNLNTEAQNKLAAANAIKVNTKDEDQRNLDQLNQNADAAQAFLKGGGVWAEFKKQAAESPLLGGASKALIDSTEAGGMEQANKMIAQRNAYAEKVAANDDLRKKKEDLTHDAAKAAADAAKLGLEIPDIIKNNAIQNAEVAQESASQLAEDKAKDAAESNRSAHGHFQLNEQQRLGAYAATPDFQAANLDLLRQIKNNTAHLNPGSPKPPGLRPPKFGPNQRHS
jgi:hypothetical protein